MTARPIRRPPIVWSAKRTCQPDSGGRRPASVAQRLERADGAIEAGIAHEAAEVYVGTGFDEHLSVQSRHPPLVLVLDVTVCAPAHHDDRELVGAGPDGSGDVVLTRQAAVGAVADEGAVDVHRVDALCAPEVKDDLSPGPARRDRQAAPVDAGGVALGQTGRRTSERHPHIGVLREIADVLQGPVAGHGDLRPSASGCRADDGGGRNLVRCVEQSEVPPPVQRAPPARRSARAEVVDRRCRRRRRSHVEAAQRDDVGIGPWPDVSDRRQHGGSLPDGRPAASISARCASGRSNRAPQAISVGLGQAPSWTQTGVFIGMMPLSQIQSMAGTLTRTQPCDAG